ADLARLAVDLARGRGELALGLGAEVVGLIAELLLPRRRVGERDQVTRAPVQLRQRLARLRLVDVVADGRRDFLGGGLVVVLTVDVPLFHQVSFSWSERRSYMRGGGVAGA